MRNRLPTSSSTSPVWMDGYTLQNSKIRCVTQKSQRLQELGPTNYLIYMFAAALFYEIWKNHGIPNWLHRISIGF